MELRLFEWTTGVEFILRWIHFMAGITWIGMLYYFNFVQTPFFKDADGAVKSGMIRGLVPRALWWFRWGAMFTFLSGLLIVGIKLHQHLPVTGAYMTMILTGGLLGTMMWFNVWFIIWPAQKVVIASAVAQAGGGQAIPEAAARGAKAGMASRTNTLFSIPMLFFMGAASHMPIQGAAQPNHMMYWVIVLVLVALVEINALIGPGATTQKPLTSVAGTIHSGLALALILYLAAEFTLG
jgi:uncharacterized membrane protein